MIDSIYLEHLLTLARKGKGVGSSESEKRARTLVLCVIENAIGLDGKATQGVGDLIDLVQANPQSGTDTVRQAIGYQRRAGR